MLTTTLVYKPLVVQLAKKNKILDIKNVDIMIKCLSSVHKRCLTNPIPLIIMIGAM